jgi:tyrosine-specific transport protein
MPDNFSLAVALLLGTMIGAGIFGVPYAISRSGIIPGFFYFLFLAGAVSLIHLFFGEIVLRTKEKHRLPGYAERYLGKKGKALATFATILGTTLVLLAYIILGGDFLEILFSPFFELSSFQFSLIFSLVLGFFIFKGIKLVAIAEFFTNLSFIFIIFLIFCFALPKINFQNFYLIDLQNIFLPYGIILFSLTGWSAIPEMGELLRKKEERKKLKKIILFSVTISTLLYIIFTFSVIGISGQNTSANALSGLFPYLSKNIVLLGVLAGAITIGDSFLILGLYLRNSLIYDFKVQKKFAFLIAWGIPLVLFLSGLREFIEVIGLAGTLIGAIEGIIIILIFKKAKLLGNREPEYNLKVPNFLLYILMAIFILGTIFHFYKL